MGVTNPTEKAMSRFLEKLQMLLYNLWSAGVNLSLMSMPSTCMKLERRQLKLRTCYFSRNIVAFLIKLLQRFKELVLDLKMRTYLHGSRCYL